MTYQGDSYRYSYDTGTRSGTWTGPTNIPGVDSSGSPTIACASPAKCVVTVHDDAYSYDGTSWQTATVPLDEPRGAVCVPDDFCAAFGATEAAAIGSSEAATVYPYRGGINDVDCVTPTFCVAVGDGDHTAVMRGSTWTATLLPLLRDLISVSCPTTTFCLAVGHNGTAQYDGKAWQVRKGDPPGLRAVSCSTPTYCVALSYTRAHLLRDGVWTDGPVTMSSGDNPIALRRPSAWSSSATPT